MPRPCMWEYTCGGCGDTYVTQGTVDDVDVFDHRCMSCAMDGNVVYMTRNRLA